MSAAAAQHRCHYLFPFAVKGGTFYSSQAESRRVPSCEILLTKVLSKGHSNSVC